MNDIVDALEMQFDEQHSYVDLDSGEVVTVSEEEARDHGNEDPNVPEWQKEVREIARRVATTDRFLELPGKFDVDDWEIMQDFCHSVESKRIREDLLHAIHGGGAFPRFKDATDRHRIETAWYVFRTEALRQIAIEWCEENQITGSSSETGAGRDF